MHKRNNVAILPIYRFVVESLIKIFGLAA